MSDKPVDLGIDLSQIDNNVRKQNFLKHIKRLKDEGYDTYAKIEKAFEGVNASFISQVANGTREVTEKIAAKYEGYFNLPEGYLSSLQPRYRPKILDIVKWGYVDDYTGGNIDVVVDRIDNVTKGIDVVAVRLQGDTLLPYFADNDILIFDYSILWSDIGKGDIVVYESDNDMGFYKMVLKPNGNVEPVFLCGHDRKSKFIGKLLSKISFY